jgi:hypothetical protein
MWGHFPPVLFTFSVDRCVKNSRDKPVKLWGAQKPRKNKNHINRFKISNYSLINRHV